MATSKSVTDDEAERIDNYLGQGTYDDWHNFDVEAATQLRRKKHLDDTLWRCDTGSRGSPLTEQSGWRSCRQIAPGRST